MAIKSKKKFIRAILLIIGLTVALVLIMTGKTFSHQEVKYKNVSVTSGDTLWNIAKSEQNNNPYYKGNDVRDIIESIKIVNNLSNSNLSENQVLDIPTY